MKMITLDTEVIKTNPDFTIELTISNNSDVPLKNWTLISDFDRFIVPSSMSKGSVEQVGTYTEIKPDSQEVIPASGCYKVTFKINAADFTNYECGPRSAYLTCLLNDKEIQHDVTVNRIKLILDGQSPVSKITAKTAEISVIPKVNNLQINQGVFKLVGNISIVAQDKQAQPATHWLIDELSYALTIKEATDEKESIKFVNNDALQCGAYKLNISENAVVLQASDKNGFIHAVSTFIQLVKQNEKGKYFIPSLEISDKPRFDYRGVMLDCARHFHSIETVKRLINQMALYKLNYFHWHFTDDEAWRIEIKAFPQLTEIGAWRGVGTKLLPQFSHLTEQYGGFYTQSEIKEVIAYAELRGITIIPEIDIPGHCRAAIKSLPALLVDREDQSEYRSIQVYTDNILSPALAGTYEFLDKVLDEVCALFPSPYIHIGADEVPKGVWTKSEKCQALMIEQGYKDEQELQGHLLRYVENRLKNNGKRMLGWEEVTFGDKISKETLVFAWINESAAMKCINNGFDVVMQPCQYTYFDIKQDFSPDEFGVDWAGTLPLEKVYSYEPLVELDENSPLRNQILGVQCALWSEVVLNQDRIDHMLFPRLLACAEVSWSASKDKNWHDFCARLQGQAESFKRNKINYRKF